LAPGRFRLRAAPVEIGLREKLLVDEHLRPLEVGLREFGGGSGAATSGTRSIRNSPRRQWRGVLRSAGIGLGLLRLGADLGLRDAYEDRAGATRVPRSTGVATMRPAISAATSACS